LDEISRRPKSRPARLQCNRDEAESIAIRQTGIATLALVYSVDMQRPPFGGRSFHFGDVK
jgi:hypothetical protein